MKKTLIYLILIVLITSIASCNPDKFLDTPAPNFSDKTFFNSEEAATLAITGAYDPMGWYNFSQLTQWAIGDAVSDDAVKGGGGDGDYAEIYEMTHFTVTPDNPLIGERWEQLYVGINRANKVIEGLQDNDKIAEEVRERIIGEAKFLRGFYLFELVKTFGGVPIVDHVLSPSEYMNPRNSIEECYAQLETDFSEAASVLPKKSELPAEELGRATWGAAKALLTKTYIFEEKWAEADATATEIIDSEEYDLEEEYGDLFTLETDNGIESVFDIQFAFLNQPGWLDENEGSHLEIMHRSRDDRNGGWGFDQPTQDLYDEFEDEDPRREWTIISDQDVLWEGTDDEEVIYTAYDPVHNPDAVTGYNKRKGTLPESLRGNNEDQSPLNLRYIRFAEVLLWQAEARAHTGGDWQTPVNRIRERVGLDPTGYSDGIQAVYHERRVELAMEGHRYWDLVRTGRGNLMDGYSENKRYFPIPQKEINMNPNLTQNPY